MSEYDIGTTLKVDGEAAFKRAISDANKSISQMGSALTLAAAEFKKDGDAMKLMESRSKTLRSEIDRQKAVVNALNGAVKDATELYGKDSKKVEEWQAKLNRAQAKLVSLEIELENNSKGLDKNGKAFESAAGKADQFSSELQQVDNTEKRLDFQNLNIALSNLSSGLDGVINKAKEFGKAIWDNTVDASNRADEVATTAAQLGITPEVLREYRYAAQLIDTETDDIGKALSRLVNPSKDVKEALQALGVQTTRGIDWDKITPGKSTSEEARQIIQDGLQAKAAIDIFWDAIEKLSKAEDKERASQQIFGKSYQDMLPLILAGKEKWDAAVQEAKEKGIGLTDEIQDNLTTFNDSIVKLNEQFQAFKDTVGGSIAPGLTTVSDALGGFLEKLTLWAQSDEGQEALGKLSEAIAGVVNSFTEQDFTNLTTTAAGAIEKFTGALTWIVENWGTVAIGLGAIKSMFFLMNVSKNVLSVIEAMKLIKWLDVQTGAKALGDAFGKAPSAGWLTLLGKLLNLAPYAVGAAVLLTPTDTADDQWDSLYDKNGNVTAAGRANGLPDTIEEYDQMAQREREEAANRTPEKVYKELYSILNDYDPSISTLNPVDFWKKLLQPRVEEYAALQGVAKESMEPITNAFIDAFAASFEEDYEGSTIGILNILQEAIDEAKEASDTNAEAAGESISQGVADGIDTGIPAAVEAVGRLAASVLEALDGTIASVSARMAAIGGGTFSGGGRKSGGGNSYTANSNLYVETMNMNNGTDAQGLAAAMAAENRRIRAGFGS